jgi:hypothetical protein
VLFLGPTDRNEVVALRDDPREAQLTWSTIFLGGKLSVRHMSEKGIVDVYEAMHLRVSTNLRFCSWV